MRLQTRSFSAITRRMALFQSRDPSKLIFAPAGSEAHGQAEQFTKGTLTRADLHPASPIPQFHAWFSDAQAAARGTGSHPETCTLSTAELPSGRVSSRLVYLKELEAIGASGQRGGATQDAKTDSAGGARQQGDEGDDGVGGAFVVYSNWETSRKGRDLATNPHASLAFHWEGLQRQIRVEGTARRMTPAESQVYYDTRARGSRVGAWASRQSAVLQPAAAATGNQDENVKETTAAQGGESAKEGGQGGQVDDGRAQLENWVNEAEERFRGVDEIPVPDFWGGLRIFPTRVEFWQGRESRLHDRFVYDWVEGEAGEVGAAGGDGQGAGSGKGRWRLQRLSP